MYGMVCKLMMKFSIFLLVCTLWWCIFSRADGGVANILMLYDAPSEAVCLDGSPPGFYIRFGPGIPKWIIYLEGGGFCHTEDSCLERSRTRLGSSKEWPITDSFSGMLSDSQTENPDFYNWNKIFVPYCDGAFFAGNVEKEVYANGTKLYFRGFKILQAVVDALLQDVGMDTATDVILSGCSAGGLATYLHADYVKSVLPPRVKFAAIADAGFFIDVPNTKGQDIIRPQIMSAFSLHNCSASVNQACLKANSPLGEEWKCLTGQVAEAHITSDLFGINSKYDTWQLANIVQLSCTPPKCSDEMMKALEKFGEDWAKASADFANREGRGVFFDSCINHCHSLSSLWNTLLVGGQSVRETVGNWYFGRSTGKPKEVDCPRYPCNKSC